MQRTIVGNLGADPEVIQAGAVRITKLRVIENTGEYRAGKFVGHGTPTTHRVEAKFELGENLAESLNCGDAVIVVGYERTECWGEEGSRQYGRVIVADHVGPSLARATAHVLRNPKAPDVG